MVAARLGKPMSPSLLISPEKGSELEVLQKVIRNNIETNAKTCHSTRRRYLSNKDTQLVGPLTCIMAGSLLPPVC